MQRKMYFGAAVLGLLLGLWMQSAAAAEDYMGHCTSNGAYAPREVISACENFIDHVYKENWKGQDLPSAFYNLALAYKAIGDTANQKKSLELAVRYAPGYVDAWRELVEMMTDLRGNDSTTKAVDLMIAAHPNDSHVLNEACWTRATTGLQLQTALANCNQSLQIDPGSADTLNSRGLVEYRLADYAAAIKDDTAALAVASTDANSLYVRGLAELKSGNATQGNADIAAAKALDPMVVDAYAKYGVTP